MEGAEDKRLSEDAMTQWLTGATGNDYKEAMKGTGDPVNLAMALFPAAEALKAAEAGGKLGLLGRTAAESAKAVALANAGLAIQDPNATWAQHVQASKDMLATSLGLAGARAAFKGAREAVGGLKDKAAGLDGGTNAAPQPGAAEVETNKPSGEAPPPAPAASPLPEEAPSETQSRPENEAGPPAAEPGSGQPADANTEAEPAAPGEQPEQPEQPDQPNQPDQAGQQQDTPSYAKGEAASPPEDEETAPSSEEDPAPMAAAAPPAGNPIFRIDGEPFYRDPGGTIHHIDPESPNPLTPLDPANPDHAAIIDRAGKEPLPAPEADPTPADGPPQSKPLKQRTRPSALDKNPPDLNKVPGYPGGFNELLTEMKGPRPKDMQDPHAHHILAKKGLGEEQQALVSEGQAILRHYGIDPIYGKENLTWAPWRVAGQHHIDSISALVKDLRDAHASGRATYEKVAGILEDHAEIAKSRGTKRGL